MSVVELNGVAVCSGRILFPLQGRWYAELTLQGTDEILVEGPVLLDVGGRVFRGFATSSKDRGNRVSVEVVGGAGGIGATVTPTHYVEETVAGVLRAALAVGGERLSATSDASVTSLMLPMWTRAGGKVSDAVKRVLAPSGASWRVLDDGSIWVGKETWPEQALDIAPTDERPTQSMFQIGVESATVLPGVTIAGRRISSVTYNIDDTRIRADLTYGERRGGTADDLAELVRRELAPLDFFGSYVVKVVGQNADGTLEILSTDTRIPKMSKVPLRAPPGVTEIRVAVGTLVVLEFDNGDPSKPFCGLARMASCEKYVLSCPDVRLGGDLAEFLAIASKVKAQLDALALAHNTHTHSGGTIGGSTGTPAAPVQVQDVAATKTKGE